MIDDRTATLAKILGEQDAIFWPFTRCDFLSPRPTNVYFARRDFPTLGVPFLVGGSEANRKAGSRMLDQLVGELLVKVSRARLSKVVYVRLSDEADELTRRLCDRQGLYSAGFAIEKLADHSKREPKFMLDAWVSERLLARGTGPHDRADVADALMPAFRRGWATSNSDGQGRVYYALTAAGWDALDRADYPQEDYPPVADHAEAFKVYDERLSAALERLEAATPRDPAEIGILPLPCSMGHIPLTETWRP